MDKVELIIEFSTTMKKMFKQFSTRNETVFKEWSE